jgi:hypothetical protein
VISAELNLCLVSGTNQNGFSAWRKYSPVVSVAFNSVAVFAKAPIRRIYVCTHFIHLCLLVNHIQANYKVTKSFWAGASIRSNDLVIRLIVPTPVGIGGAAFRFCYSSTASAIDIHPPIYPRICGLFLRVCLGLQDGTIRVLNRKACPDSEVVHLVLKEPVRCC